MLDRNRQRGQSSPLPRLVLLALFFFGGVILGQVLTGRVPADTGQELTEYLQAYVALEEGVNPRAVLSALVLYYRYPLLAMLLGFASLGVVLLPGLTAVPLGLNAGTLLPGALTLRWYLPFLSDGPQPPLVQQLMEYTVTTPQALAVTAAEAAVFMALIAWVYRRQGC